MTPIELQGFVADVRYAPQLTSRLTIYTRDDFDINRAAASGIIEFGNDRLAYSKWVSPKRTRSYPFARIYDTYHLNTKKITIIPIIKDEGANGDNDSINFITWSWMNLLNVYIVLAWYDTAQAHHTRLNCVTEQQFDTEYVRAKIDELAIYQASALHWNTSHFQKDFEPTLMKAVQSYEMIGQVTGAKMHASAGHRRFLQRCQEDGVFTLAGFKQATLTPSLKASLREVKTIHKREFLEGVKAIITVKNYLGGVYYLTVDEVISTQDGVILQESVNHESSKASIPSPCSGVRIEPLHPSTPSPFSHASGEKGRKAVFVPLPACVGEGQLASGKQGEGNSRQSLQFRDSLKLLCFIALTQKHP